MLHDTIMHRLLLAALLLGSSCSGYDSSIYLNDNILFHLSAERHSLIEEEKIDASKLVPVVTADQEKLQCLLPYIDDKVSKVLFWN